MGIEELCRGGEKLARLFQLSRPGGTNLELDGHTASQWTASFLATTTEQKEYSLTRAGSLLTPADTTAPSARRLVHTQHLLPAGCSSPQELRPIGGAYPNARRTVFITTTGGV